MTALRHRRDFSRHDRQIARLRLAERLPGREAALLDTGCCGMVGALGMLEAKYDLSLKVDAPLVSPVTNQPNDAAIAASGTSCRPQIDDVTPR